MLDEEQDETEKDLNSTLEADEDLADEYQGMCISLFISLLKQIIQYNLALTRMTPTFFDAQTTPTSTLTKP